MQRFTYDPVTGEIRHRITPPHGNPRKRAGDIATSRGSRNPSGGYYLQVYVGEPVRKYFDAQRLAWFLHYKEWPKGHVDHADTDTTNNRILNLRDVSIQQNTWNSHTRPRKGSSQYKGVIFKRIRWSARIRKDNVLYDLGLYDSEEDAALAYNRRALELFGEYAGLNPVVDDGRTLTRRPPLY